MVPRLRRALRKITPISSTGTKRNGRSWSRPAASSRSEGMTSSQVSGLTYAAHACYNELMRPHAIRHCSRYLALALLLIAPQAAAMDAGALPAATADAMAQAVLPQAIAEYRRKLREYQEARAAFEQEASAYWSSIAEKRRGRNAKRRERQTIALDDYVLTQPPVYSGPKRPVDPSPVPTEPPEPRERKYIPVVADLLKAAAEHFQFAPQRPPSEVEIRRCGSIRSRPAATAITTCNRA